jgi:hypothetical protein
MRFALIEVNGLSTFSPGCVPLVENCDLLRAKTGHDIGSQCKKSKNADQIKLSWENRLFRRSASWKGNRESNGRVRKSGGRERYCRD